MPRGWTSCPGTRKRIACSARRFEHLAGVLDQAVNRCGLRRQTQDGGLDRVELAAGLAVVDGPVHARPGGVLDLGIAEAVALLEVAEPALAGERQAQLLGRDVQLA